MNATAPNLHASGATISARSFAAAQGFITAVKVYWHVELFPAVHAEYEHRAAAAAATPETVDDVGPSTNISVGSSGTCNVSSTRAVTGSWRGIGSSAWNFSHDSKALLRWSCIPSSRCRATT